MAWIWSALKVPSRELPRCPEVPKLTHCSIWSGSGLTAWKARTTAAINIAASSPLIRSIAAKQVAGVDLVGHIGQLLHHAVGEDHITLGLELGEIPDHPRAEELLFVQYRLVHHHLDALGLDALHHALHGAGAEVVGAGLHDQPVDADHLGLALQHRLGDEILAGAVGLDDGLDQ